MQKQMPMSGSNNFRNGYINFKTFSLECPLWGSIVHVGPVKTLHSMGSGGGEFCKI